MIKNNNLFEIYGISRVGLMNGISYDIESASNDIPWNQIDLKTDDKRKAIVKKEINGNDDAINIINTDFLNYNLFVNSSINNLDKNIDTPISTLETSETTQILDPFTNDNPIELSSSNYEMITSKIPDFKSNIQKGCYDVSSVGFDTSKFLTLYSLLNRHSLDLSGLVGNVKIDEEKLQNVIQSNFNEILVLKSNLDSILKNYQTVLKGDTNYNHSYEQLKVAFADLMQMDNATTNELTSINKFSNNFNIVKGNKMVLNLLCLPNIILLLYELEKIDEMIEVLFLYDQYKSESLKSKSKFQVLFNRVDDEIYEIVKQHRLKVLSEVREDLDVTNFDFQDLLVVGSFAEEAVDLENKENIFQVFKRLLISNYNYNTVGILFNDFIEKEADSEEVYVSDIIEYWISLQLNNFEQALISIQEVVNPVLKSNNMPIINKIVKNDSNILRYMKNYLTFLTMKSAKNPLENEEDEDEDVDDEDFTHVKKLLSIFFTMNINSKESNEFWKQWNKLYEKILPLLNNLSNFNVLIQNLTKLEKSELYAKFLSDFNDFKKLDLVDELFDHNDHLIPKEYYTIQEFFKERINIDNVNKPYEANEIKYAKIYISDKNETFSQDLQIVENNVKEKLQEFIQKSITSKFFDDHNKLHIDSDYRYLNWVKSISTFSSDLKMIYSKLKKEEDLTLINHNFTAILNQLLLKDINSLLLLEDWKSITDKNNLTISALLFEQLLSMHLKILFDIDKNINLQTIMQLIYDSFNILIKNYSQIDKQLLILHNLDHLKHSTIPRLEQMSQNVSFVESIKLIDEFKTETLNGYILKDCKKLYKIVNQATPYKNKDFSTYCHHNS
ncbi:hypothetical protein QEN19_001864 [Hanseniaspora menglaensis]